MMAVGLHTGISLLPRSPDSIGHWRVPCPALVGRPTQSSHRGFAFSDMAHPSGKASRGGGPVKSGTRICQGGQRQAELSNAGRGHAVSHIILDRYCTRLVRAMMSLTGRPYPDRSCSTASCSRCRRSQRDGTLARAMDEISRDRRAYTKGRCDATGRRHRTQARHAR